MTPGHTQPGRKLSAVILLLALVLAGSMSSVAASPRSEQEGVAPTTVFLVRHAEKGRFPEDDPYLNDKGKERAVVLAHVLEEAGVTAIYATQYRRTQETVQPLADRLGLEISVVAAKNRDGLAGMILREHAGEVVLVVGHSNTVPDIIEALGAGRVEPIEEEREYDNLYVVTVGADSGASVLVLKYGADPK